MSHVAPTFDGRLACASNCAYGVSVKNGEYVPPRPYNEAVGWTVGPQAISAPKADDPDGPRINACLVGMNQDGIVAAFRGTLPPAWTVASLEDWWQDVVDSEPIAVDKIPGKVHAGFWAGLQTLWPEVYKAIDGLKQSHPNAVVHVTGHSKGGPLATLASAQLIFQRNQPPANVVTFASPHPGDETFVDAFPKSVPVTRYENYLDIVPFLPPTKEFFDLFKDVGKISFLKPIVDEFCKLFPSVCEAMESADNWDYASLGTLQYTTSDGGVVGQSDARSQSCVRLLEILLAVFGYHFSFATIKLICDALEEQKGQSEIHLGEPASAAVTQELGSKESLGLDLTPIEAAHCIACKKEPTCAGGYITGSGASPIC